MKTKTMMCQIVVHNEEDKTFSVIKGDMSYEQLRADANDYATEVHGFTGVTCPQAEKWFSNDSYSEGFYPTIILMAHGYSEYLICNEIDEENSIEVCNALFNRSEVKLPKKNSPFGKNYFSKKDNLQDACAGSGSFIKNFKIIKGDK
jgi:hypothetical protein